jgi:hypothetical protein
VPVNNFQSLPSSNPISSATASGSCQLSLDPYDFSCHDEEDLVPKHVGEMTPDQSNRAVRLLTAARLTLDLPPEPPKNWGQINPNLNNYHSDPMELSSTFWIPDTTDWWCQNKETHSKYAYLPNVARDIFSIIT